MITYDAMLLNFVLLNNLVVVHIAMLGLVLNDFPTSFLYCNGIFCMCIDASLLQVPHVASKE